MMLKKESHYADADEALDPIEADDYVEFFHHVVAEPLGCLGFACPEKSSMCDRCKIIAQEGLFLESFVEPPAKPAVQKFAYERRKWFTSEPPIGSPNEAKHYVRSGAPVFRGGLLSAILRHTVKFS